MRPIKRMLAMAAMVAPLLAGCSYYSFPDIYPHAYGGTKPKDGRVPAEDLGDEFLSTLPVKFQLAHYTGHLWCYQDWEGGISVFTLDGSMQSQIWSQPFRSLYASAREDDSFDTFAPVAYPNRFCVMPDVEVGELFDETWFGFWLSYLTRWEAQDIENRALAEENRKLAVSIADTRRTIAEIDTAIADYRKRIAETEAATARLQTELDARRGKMSTMKFLAPEEPKAELPPFDLKTPYDREKDPFVDVVKDHVEDVSGRPWATDQMQGGKYLDVEFAKLIDAANEAFAHPENIKDAALKAQVEALKAAGFTGIKVTSGARTPLRQAHLYAAAKKDGNPVAKYVRSAHMFGQAADLSLPAGWGWSSANHKSLRETLAKLGLDMGVANDPVHFAPATFTRGYAVRRLAMVRAYHAKAMSIARGQEAVRSEAIFDRNKLTEQRARAEADLRARRDELNKQADLFTRVSAAYTAVRQELDRVNAEIARREREAARRERENARDGGGGRPHHFDRPRPEPPQATPREPPRRDPPRREPPRRDPPPDRGPRLPRLG
jgi:hypothetical protein